MSAKIAEGRNSKRWLPFLVVFTLVLLSAAFSWFGGFEDAGTSVIGSVVSATGIPVEGARAYLRVPTGSRSKSLFPADSSVADSAGCFSLISLHPPGSVEISVLKDGHHPFKVSAAHGSLSVEVVLRRTADQEGSRGRLGTTSVRDGVGVRCGGEGEGADVS